jgi:hypothetical protein
MAWTIAAVDPLTQSRGLLVEVHPELGSIPAHIRQAFMRRLFERSIRVGMIVTPEVVEVIRDGLTSMEYRKNEFTGEQVKTEALLRRAEQGTPREGREFVEQVRGWLDAVGSSWFSFLDDSAVGCMVPDVVGHLANAKLETWDGILETHDAA